MFFLVYFSWLIGQVEDVRSIVWLSDSGVPCDVKLLLIDRKSCNKHIDIIKVTFTVKYYVEIDILFQSRPSTLKLRDWG